MPEYVREKGKASHIKLSLNTRDPKEALRYSRILAYHAYALIQSLSSYQEKYNMNYGEIQDLLKAHFSSLLDRVKEQIARDGVFNESRIEGMQLNIDMVNQSIDEGIDHLDGGMLVKDGVDDPMNIDTILKMFKAKYELDLEKDSKAHKLLREEYKFAYKNFWQDVISYNAQQRDYSFLKTSEDIKGGVSRYGKPEHRLVILIDKYLNENKHTWSVRTFDEHKASAEFLYEVLGKDFDALKLDGDKAREVKDTLARTPARRKVIAELKSLPLNEQIKAEGFKKLASATCNKYLSFYKGLYKWLVNNKYCNENPFEGMSFKEGKGKKKDTFTKEDIQKMTNALGAIPQKANNRDMQYWGILIAMYTGARLNEIGSLTPNDVKEHNGIVYFDINDEEADKRLKTQGSKRLVPVHSELLNRGFMDYVEKSRKIGVKRPQENTRLLYDLTFSEKTLWGRNLGRWANNTFFVNLGIKTKKKSFHSLRHSFITFMTSSGVEYETVRKIVGHSSGDVTARYTHASVEDLPVLHNAIEKLEY